MAGRKAGTFSLGMAQRLGIAATLLGDPPILIFDEPVNGLDPEGIVWARTLMQSLARQGRTVFVSSHLMSEMALTATRVIVIGKGHLIADSTVDALVKGATSVVRLRTPMPEAVSPRLQAAGASVQTTDDGALMVTGLEPSAIGDIAFYAQAPVHELSLLEASLEEAFMELTRDDVEYHARGDVSPGPGRPNGDRAPQASWPHRAGHAMTPTTAMSQPMAPSRPAGVKPPRPIDTLRAEWTKLRSVRSTPITLAVIAVMVVGLSGLITLAVVSNHRHGTRVTTDPVGILQSAWFLGLLAFMVLGVLVMTSEYSSGLIGPTLLATPKRLRVLIGQGGRLRHHRPGRSARW